MSMLEYLQSRYMESPISRDNIGNNSQQVFRLRVYKNHEGKEEFDRDTIHILLRMSGVEIDNYEDRK